MKFLIYIGLSLFPGIMWAQSQSYNITGTIRDEDDNPVSFGNAAAYYVSDSTLAGGAVSNEVGRFEINVPSGKYYVKVSFLSYEDNYISNVVLKNQDINLGVIVLKSDADILDEVVVEGQRGQMQLELDRRVFNVSEDLTNASRNASDILDNIPSVTVDVDGNVSLRGSESVRILVDGKPSGLVGISTTDALRQLQGNIIERVEVVTNPSAKYEAEGSAGVINIVLKKDRKKGFNGAFSANVGYPTELGLSGNVNYRAGKFNIFGNYGVEYNKRPGNGYSSQTFYPGTDSSYTTNRDRDHERGGISHAFRMGAEYSITDNDMISASGLFRISDEDNESTITYDDYDVSGNLSERSVRQDNETEDDQNQEYELIYKRMFNGEGHELTANFQYRDGNETEDSDITESYPLDAEQVDLLQRSVNKEGDENFLIQSDYTYPITKKKKLQAGYRGTIRQITSDYLVEEQDEQGQWASLENFSNQFIYNEDVHAAYVIFENDMPKWGYQLGLRSEYTAVSTYQRESDDSNERDYMNFFPSVFLSYKLNQGNTLQTSYSRRISRPRFWYLNPFFSYSDRRNIRTGNPYLDPEFTDSYEIGWLGNRELATLYGGIYYRRTTDLQQRVNYTDQLEGDSTLTTFSKPFNIGTEDAFGIEANFTYDPVKWLSLNGNANFYRSIIEGEYEGLELDRDTYTYNFQFASKAKVGEMDIQLRGNYRAPQNTTQGEREDMYWIDLGANWKIMEGKGIFNVSIRDLFNTRMYKGTTETEDYIETSEFQWRSRQVSLTFTYLLNRKPGKDGGKEGGDFGGGDMEM